jgi:LDH2 family malate/lactate/ureidoglycolate dehydrogenase
MSFTESSASGVLMSARQGQQVPPGVLLDEHGEPTTDATAFQDPVLAATFGEFCLRGTLVPLGGGHKGYAMVLVLGLLSALLSDSDPPWDLYYHLPERGRYGTLLWAVDPTALTGTGADDVGERVDAFLGTVTSSPSRDGAEVLYPGQRSQMLARERRERGSIAVPRGDLDGMDQLARELGIAPLDRSAAAFGGETGGDGDSTGAHDGGTT